MEGSFSYTISERYDVFVFACAFDFVFAFALTLSLRSNFSEMEGSYSYTTSEGYDDFLKERGVPWIGRKLIIAAPIQLEVGFFSS